MIATSRVGSGSFLPWVDPTLAPIQTAVGVLGMGILGAPLMGLFLDQGIDADLREKAPALHAEVNGGPKDTMFGTLPSIDQKAAAAVDILESVRPLWSLRDAPSEADFTRYVEANVGPEGWQVFVQHKDRESARQLTSNETASNLSPAWSPRRCPTSR